MSAKTYSDEEQEPQQPPSLQTLLSENRMKDLAVKKATNLIELLNIELEVERNSHHEATRLLEQQLQQEQADNHRLRTQIHVLERSLHQQYSPEHPTKRHDSRLNISRANSLHSLEKRKRSVNKKYTEQTVESNEPPKQLSQPVLLFGNALIRQQIAEIEEWKNHAVQELADIVKTEYEELGQIISNIETNNEEFEALSQLRPKARSRAEDMVGIIKAQQALINAQRHYAQQLEDLLHTAHSQLPTAPLPTAALPPALPTDSILTTIRAKRQEWSSQLGNLQAENSELKNILDNMIALVKEQKRGRS